MRSRSVQYSALVSGHGVAPSVPLPTARPVSERSSTPAPLRSHPRETFRANLDRRRSLDDQRRGKVPPAIVMSWTSVSPGPGTRGFRAGYAAEDGDARQAMQGKASRRLTRTIEARNDATMKVDHLAFLTDPQTRDRVVQDRRRPGGVERRLLDLEHRHRLSEAGALVAAEEEEPVPDNRPAQRPAELVALQAVVLPLAVGPIAANGFVALNRLSRRNSNALP